MEENNYNVNEEMSMEQNTEGVEYTMTENVEWKENEDFKKGSLGGFLAGLGTGLTIGGITTVAAVFTQRRKRLVLLAALQDKVRQAQYKIDNPKETTMTGGKKDKDEIDLTKVDVQTTDKLIKHIQDAMSKVRLNKKERKQWIEVFEDLMKVSEYTAKAELTEQGRLLSEDAKREDGKDNKIVE